jgi:hypothetical protein
MSLVQDLPQCFNTYIVTGPGTAMVTILAPDNSSYSSRSCHGFTKVAHMEAILPSGITLGEGAAIKVEVKSLPQPACLGFKGAVDEQ